MVETKVHVPVGFRFHPTDEELVSHYLYGKVATKKIDLDLIRDLDLYKFEPWDLHELCRIGAETEKQTDWYFFSHKDKKYPTGNRANRATALGFWKATGRDKPIHTKIQLMGMRKTLVFYKGRAPHGEKTDWIMHEFRLDDGPGMPAYEDGGWVVCRVFRKAKNFKTKSQERACSYEEQAALLPELPYPERHSMDGGGGGGYHSFAHNSLFSCKQEINVDDYNQSSQDPFPHLAQLEMPRFEAGNIMTPSCSSTFSCHNMPSASTFRGILASTSSKKDDYYALAPFTLDNPVGDFDDTRSSVTHEGNFSGFAHDDGVDWALLEGAGKDIRFPSNTTRRDQSIGDVTIHVQLKRQNSDHFSSSSDIDLWNFGQK